MTSHDSPLSPVLAYVVKVWVAGLAAAVLVPLAVVTGVWDWISGAAPADRLSTRVLRWSAALEVSIDAHGDLTDLQMARSERA